MNKTIQRCYAFSEFYVDVSERRLLRNKVTVPLAPKVFDTLLVLLENSGHLIEKDEFMNRLWPDTFVGEDALARNISILRKALGETSDSQTLIATVPTRGYRFVASVREVGQPGDAAEKGVAERAMDPGDEVLTESIGNPSAAPGIYRLRQEVDSPSWRRRTTVFVVALALGIVAGLVSFFLLSPARTPIVIRTEQITHSGRVDSWARIVSDGSRIYFLERDGDHWNLVQTSVAGGEARIVSAPFRNTVVLDISPDHANLLIASFAQRGAPMPLWIWPVQGGALKRVGEINTYAAAWCPNGHQIVYAEDDGLYLSDTDGANAHKFAGTEGQPGKFSWSPDGQILRFTVFSQQLWTATIWEINSDGGHLHRLLSAWDETPEEYAGPWSADAKYFFFDAKHLGARDIWAMRQGRHVFRAAEEPTRMTAGPMSYEAPLLSADGRRLFVVGVSGKSELVRYDFNSHQVSPVLPGICTNSLTFSRDGNWVACMSTQDGTILRMKQDGTERLALTTSALEAWDPNWSPDGKRIIFVGLPKNRISRIFIIPVEGGSVKELFPDNRDQNDPVWSPNGKFIAFARAQNTLGGKSPTSFAIELLDLSTNQLSLIPGSAGIRAPAWSPDGRFIAAVTEDLHKLMLFDFQSHRWRQLADATMLYGRPKWSKDGNSLYFQDLLGANEPIYRIRLRDGKREKVAAFGAVLTGGIQRVALVGFSRDDSPLLSLDHNRADIYSLDVELP